MTNIAISIEKIECIKLKYNDIILCKTHGILMKNIYKYHVVIALVAVSMLCSCRRDPLPKDALNKDKFAEVLLDVHLSESMSNERSRLMLDTIKNDVLYISVLEKHGITEEQMLSSILYYSRHPREYDKVYSEILSRITQMLESFEMKDVDKVNPDKIQADNKQGKKKKDKTKNK